MALQAMCTVRRRGQAGHASRQKCLHCNVGRPRVSPLLRPASTTVLLRAQVAVAPFTAPVSELSRVSALISNCPIFSEINNILIPFLYLQLLVFILNINIFYIIGVLILF